MINKKKMLVAALLATFSLPHWAYSEDAKALNEINQEIKNQLEGAKNKSFFVQASKDALDRRPSTVMNIGMGGASSGRKLWGFSFIEVYVPLVGKKWGNLGLMGDMPFTIPTDFSFVDGNYTTSQEIVKNESGQELLVKTIRSIPETAVFGLPVGGYYESPRMLNSFLKGISVQLASQLSYRDTTKETTTRSVYGPSNGYQYPLSSDTTVLPSGNWGLTNIAGLSLHLSERIAGQLQLVRTPLGNSQTATSIWVGVRYKGLPN
ncbi:MAG: hypothetical protein HY401_08240 [Elusimicrobia bacterium]|nr:hypothetical protein [Elusimicrobiota bacterium]